MDQQPYPFPRTAEALAATYSDGSVPTPMPAPAPTPAAPANPFDASQIAAAAAAAAAGAPTAPAASQADATAALDAFAAVNLDEVNIGTITVPFVEWVEQPLPADAPEGAEPARLPVVRKVTLSNFVPMFVFNQSLAIFQQMADNKDQAKNMELMASSVLLVWNLTDPRMTLQRLLMGADFTVIMKLFNDFFAAKLRQIGLRVGPAASLSSGRG